jgi:hypothetical protein
MCREDANGFGPGDVVHQRLPSSALKILKESHAQGRLRNGKLRGPWAFPGAEASAKKMPCGGRPRGQAERREKHRESRRLLHEVEPSPSRCMAAVEQLLALRRLVSDTIQREASSGRPQSTIRPITETQHKAQPMTTARRKAAASRAVSQEGHSVRDCFIVAREPVRFGPLPVRAVDERRGRSLKVHAFIEARAWANCGENVPFGGAGHGQPRAPRKRFGGGAGPISPGPASRTSDRPRAGSPGASGPAGSA